MRFLVLIFRPVAGFGIRLLARIFSDITVTGYENIPREGPVLLVSNHINAIDPTLILGFIPRRLSWMTKQEIFENPFSGTLARLYESFPVRRNEADLSALRKAAELLAAGRVVGIFPEGTRSPNAHMQPILPGAALVAVRSGVPILPVAIYGAESIKLPYLFFHPTPRPEIHITFGPVFRLPEGRRVNAESVAEGTAIIVKEISALLPERYKPESFPSETEIHGNHPRP